MKTRTPDDEAMASSARRSCIVNRRLQWKHATMGAAFVFCATLGLSSVVLVVLGGARGPITSPAGSLAELRGALLGSAVLYSGLCATAVLLGSLLATHRICGPVYAVQGYLREIANGTLPEVRPLRKNDEFKELLETVGDVVVRLQKDRSELAGLLESAAAKLTRQGAMTEAVTGSENASVADELRSICYALSSSGTVVGVINAKRMTPPPARCKFTDGGPVDGGDHPTTATPTAHRY